MTPENSLVPREKSGVGLRVVVEAKARAQVGGSRGDVRFADDRG